MKRVVSILISLILILSLCGCELYGSDPVPSPEVTLEPEPVGVGVWIANAEARFNMEYDDFGEYWSMMCDGFYGQSVYVLLSVMDLAENEAEIVAKRLEYEEKYGLNWHYEIKDYTSTPLSERGCENFKNELTELADRADIFVNAAAGWGKAEWKDFAAFHGCSVDTAQKLILECAVMSGLLRSAEVTEALELELNIEFSSGKSGTLTTSEKDTVYLVNGEYVSGMLLDYSTALFNLL